MPNGASDQLYSVTLPNGTKSTFSYDSLGRMTDVQDKVASGGANISQFTYGYDNRDLQTSVQRALGTASAQTVNYTYDNIGQQVCDKSTFDLIPQKYFCCVVLKGQKVIARSFNPWKERITPETPTLSGFKGDNRRFNADTPRYRVQQNFRVNLRTGDVGFDK